MAAAGWLSQIFCVIRHSWAPDRRGAAAQWSAGCLDRSSVTCHGNAAALLLRLLALAVALAVGRLLGGAGAGAGGRRRRRRPGNGGRGVHRSDIVLVALGDLP